MNESPEYRVRFRDRALEDLSTTFDYIRQESQSQERAMAWLDGAYRTAEVLRTFPHGYSYAIEDGIMPGTLRQLEYGAYRMIYNVDDAARFVRILRVRHAAMRPATRRDLE